MIYCILIKTVRFEFITSKHFKYIYPLLIHIAFCFSLWCYYHCKYFLLLTFVEMSSL
jgi:hypothetical protein